MSFKSLLDFLSLSLVDFKSLSLGLYQVLELSKAEDAERHLKTH